MDAGYITAFAALGGATLGRVHLFRHFMDGLAHSNEGGTKWSGALESFSEACRKEFESNLSI